MSLPEKTINQIAQTTDIAADDILIVEKSSGTKTIKYSDLMNAVKVSLGIVDTLEITEKGYIPESGLYMQAKRITTQKKCFGFMNMSNTWTTHGCYSRQRKTHTERSKHCSKSMKEWE